MTLPNYTAEASLGPTAGRYRGKAVVGSSPAGGTIPGDGWNGVVPSRISRSVAGRGPNGELIIGGIHVVGGPTSCDLACGGARSDCFSEGGSMTECDQAHSGCLMGCFFNSGEGGGGFPPDQWPPLG